MLNIIGGFLICYLLTGLFIAQVGINADRKMGHKVSREDFIPYLLIILIWPWPLKYILSEF